MVRVALLAGLVTLTASGAFLIRHNTLSAYASRSHNTSARASVGCGCSLDKVSDLTGSWTPPATDYTAQEIARMPTALLLPAGKTLSLCISKTAPTLAPPLRPAPGLDATFHEGGTWSAKYGRITDSGQYTAPRFIPGGGIDAVSYDFPDHPEWSSLQVNIRVLPNPAIPGSSSTPYIPLSSEINSQGQATGSIHWVPALPPGVTPPDTLADLKRGPIAVVGAGLQLAPLVTIAETGPLPTQTVDGVKSYILPATNNGEATSALYVVRPALSTTLLQGKELPILAGNANSNPDPTTQSENPPCKANTYEADPIVPGNTTKTLAPNQPSPLASVTLNATLEATVLKSFGIKIGASGTVNVLGTYYNWRQSGTKVVYKCVNGQMTYDYTAQCFITATSLQTVPNWVAWQFYNEPQNGQPNNWSTVWTCNPPTP